MSPVLIQEGTPKQGTAGKRSESRETASPDVGSGSSTNKPRNTRLKIEELEGFTRNLRLQLDAGVPLLRALQAQVHDDEASRIDRIVQDIGSQIESGRSFAEALERWPRGFPKVYRSLAHAGERSGRLEQILGELASYLAWVRGVRKTIRKALVYPCFVGIATIGLVVFLLTWLVPRFAPLFERLGDSLPFATKLLLDLSDTVSQNGAILGITAAGSIAALVLFWRTNASRRAMTSFVAKMPLTSGVVEAIELTRLTRNLSILSAAGIPIVDAIELAREGASTSDLDRALGSVHESLLQGESVSGALDTSGYFPREMKNLVAVGEEAGALTEILGRLADHYDETAKERVDRFVQSLEPITTLVLGLIVGGIAVAILSTLYQVMQQAGRG